MSIKNDYTIFYFWDIETSKIKTDNGDEVQATYLSNVIKFDMMNAVILESTFHRTVGETVEYLKQEAKQKQTDIFVYSHNLDYELTFLLRETSGNGMANVDGKTTDYDTLKQEIIFRAKQSPLQISLDCIPGVVFKCSYALLSKKVEELGDDLNERTKTKNFNKLDYDYKLTRLPWDNLTQHDYNYNERDNVIVAYSLYNFYLDNGYPLGSKPPLTFTSNVKNQRVRFINEHYKVTGQCNPITQLNKIKSNEYLDREFYETMLMAYTGGLTTANTTLLNKVVSDVYSIDIKSSYPYQMLSKRFPTFSVDETKELNGDEADNFYYRHLHCKTTQDLYKMSNTSRVKGYFVDITLYDIEVRNPDYLLLLSSYKLIDFDGLEVVNGKVRKAREIRLICSNIMMECINLVYGYKDFKVTQLYYTQKSSYLSRFETSFLLNNFDIKESVDKDADPITYALAKVKINAVYGICVQTPLKDLFEIVDGEVITTKFEELTKEEKEEVYSTFLANNEMTDKKAMYSPSFDIYSNGVFITDFGRLQLVSMMVDLTSKGCRVVYSDTDSCKFMSNNKKFDLAKHLDKINHKIIKQNIEHPRFTHYKEKFNVTDEVYNKICKVGMWDIESLHPITKKLCPYPVFKTMGAKKYAYVSIDYVTKDIWGNELPKEQHHVGEQIHTTIAGCSKKVSKSIERYAHTKKCGLEEALMMCFATGTQFDETASGRTLAKRDDRPREYMNTLTVNGKYLNQFGGIIIEDTTYTLGLSKNDYLFLGEDQGEKVERILTSEGVLIKCQDNTIH